MKAVSDPSIRELVVMAGAQVGKTEILLNIIGYHIDYDAAPILCLQPTLEMAQAFSKDRLAPMLRDTPALKGKVKDPRSRDANNTTTHKVFPGGHITMVGSNSAAGLASRPIRIILADEVDRFPASAGTEGDPISLAKKRSNTYWNRKIIMVSTPTNRGTSRIEAAYEETDKRKFFVPCPHCDHEQHLVWANVKWEKDKPETASYMCDSCGVLWDDNERNKAVRQGKWVKTGDDTGIAGFHINGIYSPWTPLVDAVKEFLSAKKMPETLRVWTNVYLAETWDDNQGDGADDYDVMTRAEPPTPYLDKNIMVLTAGIDTQGDRIEYEVVGHAKDDETFSVHYGVIYGDLSAPEIWRELDQALAETWETEDGRTLGIKASCIDSGGHYTQQVYNYVRPREAKRIFAIKGMAGESRPIVSRPSRNNIGKIRLFTLGVDNIKESVLSRLKIKEPGPGYCHFPDNRDEEYFKQLAASERIVTKFHKGFPKREFVKIRTRNEALDCRVYAMGALAILGQDVNQMARKQKGNGELPVKQNNSRIAPRRNGSFVKNW
jgi:phage terminase large subunit GpA-like protein